MPRLKAVLLALGLAAVAAPPALAQWSAPIDVPGAPDGGLAEVSFGATGQGVLKWAPAISEAFVARSADAGASWLTPQFAALNDLEVAADADGDRVWASRSSTAIRLVRTGPDGGPTDAAAKQLAVSQPNDVELAVNPAGDALIAWTTSDGRAGAAFWAAGAAAPRPPQTFASTGTSFALTPIPVLDPGRSAVVVWTAMNSDPLTYQAVAADAGQPAAFGARTQLAEAMAIRGGQAPDGRALLVLTEDTPIAPNRYGMTARIRFLLSSRGAGAPFRAPSVLAGTDDVAALDFSPRLPVAPDGRALLAFTTAANRPDAATCAQSLEERRIELAIRTVDADGDVAVGSSLLSEAGHSAAAPSAAAGSDGRLLAVWQETTDCGPPEVRVRQAAFAPAGGALSEIAAPPFLPASLTFTPNGSPYQVGYLPSSPLVAARYETGKPIATRRPPRRRSRRPPLRPSRPPRRRRRRSPRSRRPRSRRSSA